MAFSLPTTGFDFNASLSASKKIDAAKYFVGDNASDITLWDKASKLPSLVENAFSPDAPDLLGALGIEVPSSQPTGWTFITAPEDVSWDIANEANRVNIFGTNNPPVVAGSRGMRDLTLSNALVEGFQRNKNVEAKIASLESLMNYGLNTSDGFVSIPVYQVWANSKSYGGANAYFIIKDVRVRETMRDIKGNSTRAYVDISLMQVPAYQVNSGRDQANQATAGAGKILQDAATAATGATAAAAAATQVDGVKNAAAAANPAGPRSATPSVTPRPGNQRFAPLPVQTGNE